MQYSDQGLAVIKQHRRAHRTLWKFSGQGVELWQDPIDQFLADTQSHTILDYGCGKALYWPPHWQGRVHGYDPCVTEFQAEPGVADCVICLDVMEHIHSQDVASVIHHIHSLARSAVFWVISTRPANKRLPNGENCHVTVKQSPWWLQACAHPTLTQQFHWN